MQRALSYTFAFFLLSAAAASAGEPPQVPWSFAPIHKPAFPTVRDARWSKDPLDLFILAKLEAANCPPNPDADRSTLLRRAAFDLTGCPPTADELAAFLRDPAPDDRAFATVVDRLLASPRFGERWGRHWLDVARYADSVGRTWNAPFIYAWRYRDWVIDSFNQDKPFALFAAEQIAGDLLPSRTNDEKRSRLTATGFLTLAALPLPEAGSEAFALDRVDDQIDVTTRALLGLTMSCARCHNHKTDPISQRDYYALAGIFYSTQTLPGGQRGAYVDPELLLRLPSAASSPSSNPAKASFPKAGTTSSAPDPMAAMANDNTSLAGADATGRYSAQANLAMGVSEGELRDCPIRIKGEARQIGDTPPRGDLHVPGLPAMPPIGKNESGRLALAQWVASPANPLTARVAVNRVWSHLFGRGLVRTVDDFGFTGDKPTHPELLDHLAARFMAPEATPVPNARTSPTAEPGFGWSVKKLIRAIMLSRAYRLSSVSEPRRMERDGANDLFWRMNPKRLELEAIRDSMLFVSGRLSLERPAGIQVAGNGGKGKIGQTRALLDETASFRTVYLPVLRDLLPEIYRTFDFPEPTQIKGQREVTTVPTQALFFLNSRFAFETAQAAAQRLLENTALHTDEARIGRAYLTLLGRDASPEELKDARAFLASMEAGSGRKDASPARWTSFIQSLVAGTEFRYVW